ncbi:DNA polymerase [Grosmannia clavigera kw1407]|uniref:DNA polymerase n=1 Tax=Grosmannia clavigera (strain kw1407 / UAMH 11150) TaxID=655863 RepID=F0XR61_GROCL|nr:DNA polymerase [Grosmannia clavigera kw1407]EFW99855.1 DNA polymerase [Grosmannia clavigera kw1407]
MGKRKRSGKAAAAAASSGSSHPPLAKRPRVDSSGEAVLEKEIRPGSGNADEAEKDALLADRSVFAADLSRADHDRERRLYKLLGSPDMDDRLRAADVIVSALAGVSEPVLLRHIERRLMRGLASGSEASRIGFSYVLSELLGQLLGSSSSSTDAYPNLTFDRLLDLLLEKTRPGTNVPGQEERDHYWGQLFGLQSFVESGALFGSGSSGRWDRVLRCLLQLGQKKIWLRPQACFVVVQAIRRSHLPDQAAVVATLESIARGGEGETAGHSDLPSDLAKTPEGLGIWLAALERFPDMALPAPWKTPLAPGAHRELVAVLRSSGASGGGDGDEPKTAKQTAAKQGNASAQLHFVWDLLLQATLRQAPKQFDAFWVAVVDQVYFPKGASDHQKLTGFKVFQRALSLCADAGDMRPVLFSSNLVACLVNQASHTTPRLHRAAVQVLRAIECQVEDRPAVLVSVVAALLGCVPGAHGFFDLDERVKGTGDGTKPVERILRFVGVDAVDEVVHTLREGALRAPDANADQKPLRIYAEYLFRLVSRTNNSTATDNDSDEGHEDGHVSVGGVAFQSLAEIAYPSSKTKLVKKASNFSSSSSSSPAPLPSLNEKTQTASRTYLLSAAGALLKKTDDFTSFCRTVLSIEPAAAGSAMSDEIQAQVIDVRQQLKLLLRDDGDKTTAASARARQGLAVLLSVSLLQLYHEPRPDALEVLQDIKACGDKLAALESSQAEAKKKAKKAKKDKTDTNDATADEPDIGEVLIEVLLAMLADSSQLTRQASLQVFEAFAPYMSARALDNLTEVLVAEENTSGYRALFNQEGEDDEDEDEDGDDSDIEMDSDVEITQVGAGEDSASDDSDDESSDSDSGSSDSDSESESDGDDDDDDDNGNDGKTKAAEAEANALEVALMKTFKTKKLALGKVQDDDGDDSDSSAESDMSDDAMLALDGHLAGHMKLIKSRTEGRKKERDDSRKRVVAFKHRVLDLLEVYIKRAAVLLSRSQQQLVFRLLVPLVELVRDTKEPALSQKAVRIVQTAQQQLKRARGTVEGEGEEEKGEKKKEQDKNQRAKGRSDTFNVELAIDTLEAIHRTTDRADSRAFATAVSAASLAIASAVFAADRNAYRRVADVYRQTQDHWVLDGWNVRASLFTDWYNWCQSVRTRQ